MVVKENRIETLQHRSIIFYRPQGFVFEAGDWVDIAYGDKPLKGGKTYSISSSPTEPDLRITFKDGISEFKTALMNAVPGDSFTITQYGNNYKFTLRQGKSSTLIAGGVGITPFRSMLKEVADSHSTTRLSLIYLNTGTDFLFQDELDEWQAMLPNLEITYIVTSDLNKKDRTKALQDALKSTDPPYYIAGPKAMVESTEHVLLDLGVPLSDIRTDSFTGY
jgi:ferredoxin-NADP reductase